MEATTEANDAALKYFNHKLSKNTQNLPHHPQQRHYTTCMHHYNKNDFSFNNNKQGAVPHYYHRRRFCSNVVLYDALLTSTSGMEERDTRVLS